MPAPLTPRRLWHVLFGHGLKQYLERVGLPYVPIARYDVCDDGWVCEAHPELAWPHGDCLGPGMPCKHAIETGSAPGAGPDCYANPPTSQS